MNLAAAKQQGRIVDSKFASRAVSALAATLCGVLASGYASAAPHIRILGMARSGAGPAPTDEFCRTVGLSVGDQGTAPCYSPQQMRKAYGLDGLIDAGMVGAGQTIVIIDSYGSPTIAADLHTFDKGYGLPDPPSFTVLAPLGEVPWDPTLYPDQPGWAGEVTLDVEWAHAMAPGANIVLLTSPVDETEGVQGLPEFLALEQYALDHHLGTIISQSWGATENTLFAATAGAQGPQVVEKYQAFYARAVQEGITVLCAEGDTGSGDLETDGVTFYPHPVVDFPCTSPYVTSIGGTSLYLDTAGKYLYETVWNDDVGAGGGGISQLFKEPDYQKQSLPESVQKKLGGMRGVPDISYNAGCYTTIVTYSSFPGGGDPGWYYICGTSEGAPQWAGIVADLNQFAGRPLGLINPALYLIGGAGKFGQIGRDITVGNNAWVTGVPGYSAKPGWDLATGWGTPNLIEIPYRPLVLLDAN
jgi:subtilase family serine protease